jgi:Mg2+ and Co2+ transporter CorA
MYKQRIAKLDDDAARIQENVLTLLEFKAKHAGLRESHYMFIMGAAVLGFTIVTIIFMPLSFMASLFALAVRPASDASGCGRVPLAVCAQVVCNGRVCYVWVYSGGGVVVVGELRRGSGDESASEEKTS